MQRVFTHPAATAPATRANLATGLAIAAAAAWLAAGVIDDVLYLLLPLLGLGAVALGRSVGDLPRARWAARAGAAFTLLFVVFAVVAIVSGDIG